MVVGTIAENSWVQNRFLIALFLTACIMAILGIVYAVYHHRGRILKVVYHERFNWVITAFRAAVGGAAVSILLLSVFPRQDLEAGVLLYFFLWPLLGAQLVVACLPWRQFIQKNAVAAGIAALVVLFYSFHVDMLMLGLSGYWRG